MKINNPTQPQEMTDQRDEVALMNDIIDNLELEHALTWLFEAIHMHQSGKISDEPWHLYQTSLFEMYVDYDNERVRLSAVLACHDSDLEIPLKEFLEILRREASRENKPGHFPLLEQYQCIHRYRNPHFKVGSREREPDAGFYS